MKAKVEEIAAHGINCFVNRQLIYNYPESLLAEKGILVIEHADFEGVERLSLVTGGEIASTFERPDLVKLGQCELIEEIMIGEDKVRHSFAHIILSTDTGPPVDQILWRCRRRSVHRRSTWLDEPNGRRGRAVPSRRAFRALPNRKRDACRPGRWLLRDAHELRGGRGGAEGEGQEGHRGGGLRACAAADPDYPRR